MTPLCGEHLLSSTGSHRMPVIIFCISEVLKGFVGWFDTSKAVVEGNCAWKFV